MDITQEFSVFWLVRTLCLASGVQRSESAEQSESSRAAAERQKPWKNGNQVASFTVDRLGSGERVGRGRNGSLYGGNGRREWALHGANRKSGDEKRIQVDGG